MAKNQVDLTLAGDSKSLERAFDRAGAGAKDMAETFEDAGKRSRKAAAAVENVGEKAGDTEGKFTGLADVMDGLNTAFGLGLDRQIEYARASGDVLGGLEQLKGVVSGTVDGFGKVADKFGDTTKAAIGARIQTVKTAAVQAVAWAKSSAQAMASAIKVRAAWLISMGPIALVVAAVAGAVFLIVKYWDEIKAAASATWEWVRDRFTQVKDFLIEWAPLMAGPVGLVIKYWDELKGAATDAKDWVVGRFDDLVGFLVGIPGRIGRGLTGPFEGIKGGATTAKNWVVDRFDETVEWLGAIPGRIGRTLTGAWDGIKEGASGAKEWIVERFEDAITWLGGVPGRIGSKLKGSFAALADAFRGVWNGIANFINRISLTIPIPFAPDVEFNMPNVFPTFHAGGVVPGPRGAPMAIMALGGERISAPGQSGATYAITVHAGLGTDPGAVGAAVVKAIDEYERRNGQRFARA